MMKVLILVILLLSLHAEEHPASEGIFIKSEQTKIEFMAAYKMIERWPNYGGW